MKYWISFWTQVHWLAIGLVFITATWWWRTFWLKSLPLPNWLMIEQIHFYHFGFFGLVLLALGAWSLTGWRGLLTLTQDGNLWWLMLLWQLGLWGRIAISHEVRNYEVAIGESTEFLAVVLFVTSLVAHPPPLKWVVWALVVGMLLQTTIGLGQVLVQHDIGIARVGSFLKIKELTLDPAKSGVSVIGTERYLRPYGLSAHPNLMVPAIFTGLLGCWGWWLKPNTRLLAALVTAIGWWGVLLSFSRAAAGGFILGLMVFWGLWFIQPKRPKAEALPVPDNPPSQGWRGMLYSLALLGVVGAIFTGMYAHLVLGRFIGTVNREGGQASTFENFSSASRAVYIEQALDLIPKHLWLGVGRGNFAWESAWLFYCCDNRDLRGDHVHNIYLLGLSEVGIIGFSLFIGAILYGWGLIILRARRGLLEPSHLALAGGVIIWLAVGWLDHYAWTQFGHQLLFWGVFGIALGKGKKIQNPTLPT